MSNINDYLKWRGDISLKYDELNEIDEMYKNGDENANYRLKNLIVLI